MSPPCVDRTSAPRTTLVRWIGTATETIVSPKALTRTIDDDLAGKRIGDLRQRLAVGHPIRRDRAAALPAKRSDGPHSRPAGAMTCPRPGRPQHRSAGPASASSGSASSSKSAPSRSYMRRARMGRRHQAMENWADPLGIDRKLRSRPRRSAPRPAFRPGAVEAIFPDRPRSCRCPQRRKRRSRPL